MMKMAYPGQPYPQPPHPYYAPPEQYGIATNAQFVPGQTQYYYAPAPKAKMSGREIALLILAIINVIIALLTMIVNLIMVIGGYGLGGVFFIFSLIVLALGIVAIIFLATGNPGRKNIAIAFGAFLVISYLIGLLVDVGRLATVEGGVLADLVRAELTMTVIFDALFLVLGVVTAVLACMIRSPQEPGSSPNVITERAIY
jgi:hypothetical protein